MLVDFLREPGMAFADFVGNVGQGWYGFRHGFILPCPTDNP
jgi:hypothetical protein